MALRGCGDPCLVRSRPVSIPVASSPSIQLVSEGLLRPPPSPNLGKPGLPADPLEEVTGSLLSDVSGPALAGGSGALELDVGRRGFISEGVWSVVVGTIRGRESSESSSSDLSAFAAFVVSNPTLDVHTMYVHVHCAYRTLYM